MSDLNAPDFAETYLGLVELDDRRVAGELPVLGDPQTIAVAWLCGRHPLLGGEYYRATRPAALASRDFGWHTAVISHVGELEGTDRVAGQTLNGNVIVPHVFVVRPIGKESAGSGWDMPELLERAHAAGQFVIADLDDDIWSHEHWTPDSRPNDDRYEDWCYEADGWLVSTEPIRLRVLERYEARGRPHPPIRVAPNCYDPAGFGREVRPVPGRRLGTRLWLEGRMQVDLELYAKLFAPLLELLDLTFVHIGAELAPSGLVDLDGRSTASPMGLVNFRFPSSRLLEIPTVAMNEMGRVLASTLSIGAIAIADHPYNTAKTETHAIELASAGLPLVAATNLEHYSGIPGRVTPVAGAVYGRVQRLLDPNYWYHESRRAKEWALEVSARAETDHLVNLRLTVTQLLEGL